MYLISESVGTIVELTVSRKSEFGYFLTDGQEDVLLHFNDASKEYEIDEEVEVFIYIDSNGRFAASSKMPLITLGQYEWVKVVDVRYDLGVFLDIGLQKDLLLGKDDLPVVKDVWPQEGDMVYATLRVNRNNRLYARIASEQIISEISIQAKEQVLNKNIQGFVYRTAKVGTWMLSAEGYRGFIHESQRKQEPRLGQKVEGRIIDVKEDGTINVSLLPRKQEALGSDADTILDFLHSRNGAMPYWDKSMPEDIEMRFQMSKAAFKRALGKLMKEGKVYQEQGWTYIKKEEEQA
ncbi:S1 RNA-binding domain-containing protein [Bacillus sp. CGMCC 1.16607]|uniref:CvfB family protein n=1 Tax=Bacillus sp. CGMCC 1.16607 TaxID=3351842 RepID=UPI00364228AC